MHLRYVPKMKREWILIERSSIPIDRSCHYRIRDGNLENRLPLIRIYICNRTKLVIVVVTYIHVIRK